MYTLLGKVCHSKMSMHLAKISGINERFALAWSHRGCQQVSSDFRIHCYGHLGMKGVTLAWYWVHVHYDDDSFGSTIMYDDLLFMYIVCTTISTTCS